MTSASVLTCPSCHEANSTDMAFCIFCGAPLKGQAPAAMTGPVDNMKTSVSVRSGAPRTCSHCGQTDSLNSAFCIFCGSRVDGPLAGAFAAAPISGAHLPAVGQPLEGKSTEQRAARARVNGIIATAVAGVLGGMLGVTVSFFGANRAEPVGPAVQLPAHGMVILTEQPHTYFEVSNHGRRFFVGKTGINGDVSIPDLDPGEYHVKLVAPDDKIWEKDVAVQPDKPLVLGGGTDGEIFKN